MKITTLTEKCLIAAASLLLATSIGIGPASAEDPKKESEKAADTKAPAPEASEWDAYMDSLEKKVLASWFPPSGIEHYKAVKVEMRIREDGKLARFGITRSSQIREVDLAARKAVSNAAPFAPFPDSLKKEHFARFEISLDKAQLALKRPLVRKLDGWAKPFKEEHLMKESF